MPLLEEVNYIPVEKYSHAPELLSHAQNIGKKYDLYSRTLFQTEVLTLRWDDNAAFWTIKTSRGDNIRTRFVIPAGTC